MFSIPTSSVTEPSYDEMVLNYDSVDAVKMSSEHMEDQLSVYFMNVK